MVLKLLHSSIICRWSTKSLKEHQYRSYTECKTKKKLLGGDYPRVLRGPSLIILLMLSVLNDHYNHYKVSFLKSLEPSHGVLQLLEKNFYSVLLLHLLKPLFSLFHGLQALSIFFLVLVNDLYIGDPLEANKLQEICIFQ